MKVITPREALKLNTQDVKSEAKDFASSLTLQLSEYRGEPLAITWHTDKQISNEALRILQKSGWTMDREGKIREADPKPVIIHIFMFLVIGSIVGVLACIATAVHFTPAIGLVTTFLIFAAAFIWGSISE